jgi:hypothetical protein
MPSVSGENVAEDTETAKTMETILLTLCGQYVEHRSRNGIVIGVLKCPTPLSEIASSFYVGKEGPFLACNVHHIHVERYPVTNKPRIVIEIC